MKAEKDMEIAMNIGKERGIPVEAKKIDNTYYLYRDTTRWNKEKKRCARVSYYIGRIYENGLV